MTTPITHIRSYDELAADYEACLADNAAMLEQVAQLEARLRREIHAYDALQKSSDELECSRMSAILQTIGGIVDSINYLQRLRELTAAEADNAALRALMNIYNLGGWTEAIAPMKRALAAEANAADMIAEERDAYAKGQAYWVASAMDEKARAERAEAERDALRKMVNAADEMRLCLHKPIKNYADDLLDAIVAYDHARLESDAALLAGKKP